MASTNGSQFFFCFNDASVEITPKLISVVCACALKIEVVRVSAMAVPVRNCRHISCLPCWLRKIDGQLRCGRLCNLGFRLSPTAHGMRAAFAARLEVG